MGTEANRAKAEKHSTLAYTTECEKLAEDYRSKVVELQNNHAARGFGALPSGTVISEKARLEGELIKARVEAFFNTILEGYELYGVPIDDSLGNSIIEATHAHLERLFTRIHVDRTPNFPPNLSDSQYRQMVRSNTKISYAWIATEIDRRRLSLKKNNGAQNVTIYHVEGDNNRWNINSHDESVNIVVSKEQVFSDLRKKVQAEVASGPQQIALIDSINDLEGAAKDSSFKEKYLKFMSAASDHMTVVGPFIPALTEMLRNFL